MYEVERYIEEGYHITGRAYALDFQVQFITVNIDSIDFLAAKNTQVNYFRRIKRQKNRGKQKEHNKQVKRNLKTEFYKRV